jgi:hypothetical protein
MKTTIRMEIFMKQIYMKKTILMTTALISKEMMMDFFQSIASWMQMTFRMRSIWRNQGDFLILFV